MRVELLAEAIEEARNAYQWYLERDPGAAQAFSEELDGAIARLEVRPLSFPAHLHGTRRVLFRRFPYALVFRVEPDCVEVVAVAHTSRRPGYWMGR